VQGGGCSSAGPPLTLSLFSPHYRTWGKKKALATDKEATVAAVGIGREGHGKRRESECRAVPPSVAAPPLQLTECSYLHRKMDGRQRSRTKAGPARVEEKERGLCVSK